MDPDVPGSQDSLEPLSQETMNTLLHSLGGQKTISGLIGTEFEQIETMGPGEGGATNQPDDTEVQVSRTIIHALSGPGPSCQMPQWSNSQGFSQGTCAPITVQSNGSFPTPPMSHYPPNLITRPPPITYQNGALEPESPLATASHSTLTPPPSTNLAQTTPPPLTPTETAPGTPSNPASSPNSRLPFAGDYGFELVFDPDEKKVSKTTNFTYSRLATRAYIKPKCAITFTFSFRVVPPGDSLIRATPIYNSPELAGQNVYCCLSDVHQMKEKKHLWPSHFVRAHNVPSAVFCGDGVSQPSSVYTLFTNLVLRSANTWYTVYMFPCVTSHLSHKKHVELVFTLEHHGVVLGRCLVPIRVCTSPGRDRIIDENRLKEEEGPAASKQSRKRKLSPVEEPAPAGLDVTQVTQCTLPPKRACVRLTSPKVRHTVWTHPELIPYVDVCVRMMEQVYSVPQPPLAAAAAPGPSGASAPATQQVEMFPSVDAWLEHLQLSKYAKIFKNKGIVKPYQLSSITEEELKSWGIRTVAHRKKLIQEKDNVMQEVKSEGSLSTQSSVENDGGSPTLFSSLSPPNPTHTSHLPYLTRQFTRQLSQGSCQGSQNSQLSQLSSASTGQYTQSFEVVQIQLKKKISNSSSGSSQPHD